MKKFISFLKRLHKEESGQSVVEYSLIAFLVLIVGLTTLPMAIDKVIEGYDIYLGSLYFILSIPSL